jgi:quinol-cytochrome oxidoreductase complex cytochrome b subunit
MSKFMDWVDARFPATKMWEDHLSKYYAPKNFNFFYFFGSLALLVLVNQIVTGVWLTMSYTRRRKRRSLPSNTSCVTSSTARSCAVALHRRLGVLHRGLSAHVPWPALRFVPEAA